MNSINKRRITSILMMVLLIISSITCYAPFVNDLNMASQDPFTGMAYGIGIAIIMVLLTCTMGSILLLSVSIILEFIVKETDNRLRYLMIVFTAIDLIASVTILALILMSFLYELVILAILELLTLIIIWIANTVILAKYYICNPAR